MKAQEFVKLLRKVIREEVTAVVGQELRRVLNEEIATTNTKQPVREQTKPRQKTLKQIQYQREHPIVTMDDIFADTKARMNELDSDSNLVEGYESNNYEEEYNPELPVSSAQTMTLVRDYSALLKRADELADQSRG